MSNSGSGYLLGFQSVTFQKLHKTMFILGSWRSARRLMIYIYIFFLLFLGFHPWHIEVRRLGVELELYLQASATTTATPNPSRVCHLHQSSQQRWILNPLSEARKGTHIFMDTNHVCNLMSCNRNSDILTKGALKPKRLIITDRDFFFFFLQLHLHHMKVFGLGVE